MLTTTQERNKSNQGASCDITNSTAGKAELRAPFPPCAQCLSVWCAWRLFSPPGINVAEHSYRARVFFICSVGEKSDTGGDSSICAEWMMAISGAPSVLISVCGCQWSCGCARSPRARLLISVWTAIALSALRLFTQIIPAFPFLSIKGTVIYSFNFPTRAVLRIDLSP